MNEVPVRPFHPHFQIFSLTAEKSRAEQRPTCLLLQPHAHPMAKHKHKYFLHSLCTDTYIHTYIQQSSPPYRTFTHPPKETIGGSSDFLSRGLALYSYSYLQRIFWLDIHTWIRNSFFVKTSILVMQSVNALNVSHFCILYILHVYQKLQIVVKDSTF